MKNVLPFLFFFLLQVVCAEEYPSEIRSVIVYQTRAEITRLATMELTSGEQELVFPGISTFLDQNNIQVHGTGNLTILGTSFRQNYLNENKLPEELQKIKEEIELLENEIRKNEIKMASLEVERQLLEKNMKINEGQGSVTAEQLSALAKFYRERMNEVGLEILEIKSDNQQKQKELRRLRAHYNDRTSQFRKNSGEIVVNVDVKAATKAELELIYIVSSAGWRAEYDIRSSDVNEPLELSYRAIINQNTGENWRNVKLTLSTGNPNAGIIKPDLDPQYLDFYTINYRTKVAPGAAYQMNDLRQAAPMEVADEEVLREADVDFGISVASETKTMYTNYEVERSYSLGSGDKPLNVTIRQQKVEADYEYQSVPKLRPRVFLVAKARNWGELVLLPGPINIFFEGGYVGKSYMDPNVTTDDLPISLGYDPGITIERKKVTELSSKRTIGSNQKETVAYEIAVRNNKRKDVVLIIEDQVPVTKHADIKVENLELGGASYDESTGNLTWRISLKQGQQVKKAFSFDVRYPKGQNISGL